MFLQIQIVTLYLCLSLTITKEWGRMVSIILKLGLLFSPIFYLDGFSFNKASLIFYHLFCLLLIAGSFFDSRKREIKNRLIVWLLAICLFNIIVGGFNLVALNGGINLLLGCIAVKIIAEYVEFEKSFVKCMALAGGLNILVMIGQSIGYTPIIFNPSGEPGGIMGNAPNLCNYLAITLPFVFAYYLPLAVVYVLVGVFLKEIGIIGIGVIILCFHMKSLTRLFQILTLSTVGLILIHKQIFHSLDVRWLVWSPVLDQVFKNPFHGIGFGVFESISRQFKNDNAFSSLLQFFYSGGLLASIVWVCMFIKDFMKSFLNNTETVAMIAIFLLCLIEYPFETMRLWVTIIAVIAFYLIKNEGVKYASQDD